MIKKTAETTAPTSHFVLHAFNKLVNSFLVIAQQKNVIVSEKFVCAHILRDPY